jgi:DNA-binding MurR/RpiR family transcriptional regulator
MLQLHNVLKTPSAGTNGNCVIKIRSHYKVLNRAQRQLADFIIAHPETTLEMDVTRLAEVANVGAATVTRFCRRIGFGSFRQFKIALAQEIVSLPVVFEAFSRADDHETRVDKVFRAYVQSLIDTRALVSVPDMIQVVDRIAQAATVYLYGIGSSGLMAIEASHRLALLGIPCRAHVDPYEQIISASLSTRKDLVIGFSHSGTTRQTVEAIGIAKKHGAFTVAVTNHADSALAQKADVSLLTSLHEKSVHVATLTSRVAQMTLIDCLYVLLASRGLERFRKATTSIESELSRVLRIG